MVVPHPDRRSVLAGVAGSLAFQPRAFAAAVGADDPRFAPVRQKLNAAVRDGRATGLAVAVTRHGRVLWAQGFGWADYERRAPATVRTPFSLASISKPFTATAVMVLAEAGRLSLDAAADRYLGPDAPQPWSAGDKATLRQLGAHAGGLPTLFEMYTAGATTRRARSTPDLLKAYGRTVYPPGETYEYSNLGYAAFGEIVERQSGRPFAAFLRERLLQPLGMTDSFFDTERHRLEAAAQRYDGRGEPIAFYVTATPASGEVYASVRDMARFAMFHLKDRRRDQASILSDAAIDDLARPVLTGTTGGATTFAWFRGRSESGIDTLFKDGGQPGVSTTLYLAPSEHFSCVVLSNRTDNGHLVQETAEAITSAVLSGWTAPSLFPTERSTSFNAEAPWRGRWKGALTGGDVTKPVAFEVGSVSDVSLAIDQGHAAPLSGLRLQGGALIGKAAGRIGARDTEATEADTLAVRLFPRGERLVGRILASAERPGALAIIPFAVDLSRA